MLITESQMSIGRQTNVMNLLDNISYLTEAESVYAPAMVPVVENSRLNSRLIDIEDLTSFAESNGIEDLGYALSLVCEASEIDPSTVAFTVDKVSLIENEELADLASSLLNEGINVLAKPVSPHSGAAILGEACLEYGIVNGDWSLLEAFIQDDFQYLMEKYDPFSQNYGGIVKPGDSTRHTSAIELPSSQTDSPTVRNMILGKTSGNAKSIILPGSNGSSSATIHLPSATKAGNPEDIEVISHVSGGKKHFVYNPDNTPSTPKGGFQLNTKGYETYKSDTSTNYQNPNETKNTNESETDSSAPKNKTEVEKDIKDLTKDWQSKPRKWFAEKIAWLHDKAQEFNEKVHTDSKNAPWYKKVLSYVTRAIAFLTKKLHNLVAEKGKEIGDSKDGKFAYSSFKK